MSQQKFSVNVQLFLTEYKLQANTIVVLYLLLFFFISFNSILPFSLLKVKKQTNNLTLFTVNNCYYYWLVSTHVNFCIYYYLIKRFFHFIIIFFNFVAVHDLLKKCGFKWRMLTSFISRSSVPIKIRRELKSLLIFIHCCV